MSKASMIIEGFASADPDIREHNGRLVANLSIPHTPRKRENGQWVDAGETLWVRVAFWEQDAEIVRDHVRKGTLVRIEGEPVLRSFTRQDGTAGTNLEIKFPRLALIPRNGGQQAAGATSNPDVGDWASASSNGAQAGAQGDWGTPF